MLQSVETVFGTGGSRHHNDYLFGEIVSRIIPLPLGLESGSVSQVFCHMIIISTDFNCVRLQYELSWVPTAQPCTEWSSRIIGLLRDLRGMVQEKNHFPL
jgi:hypothetical protein